MCCCIHPIPPAQSHTMARERALPSWSLAIVFGDRTVSRFGERRVLAIGNTKWLNMLFTRARVKDARARVLLFVCNGPKPCVGLRTDAATKPREDRVCVCWTFFSQGPCVCVCVCVCVVISRVCVWRACFVTLLPPQIHQPDTRKPSRKQ
jgi:hypothetical protein